MKNIKLYPIFMLLVLILPNTKLISQSNYTYAGAYLNTITTAVPFLLIAPDARAAGLGDAGTSTSPDVNSQFWNPAKYAFAKKRIGISLSYAPWLRALVHDMNLAYSSLYYKPDSNQCVAASFKAFSPGTVTFTDITGNVIGTYKPFEYAGDISYSRKLAENFSCGISLRYIHSNLTGGIFIGGAETHPGTSFAGDISLFYSKPLSVFNEEGRFNFGMNISNLGSKIAYTETTERDFIPTNLRLGSSVTLPIMRRASISFILEAAKLLVPTPPIYSNGVIIAGKDPNVSVLQGIVQSFNDAPGGFNEEIREINISSGIEFLYGDMFALRAGFFYEDSTKGNRKFFTLGTGLKYNIFTLDFSYLITLDQVNPDLPTNYVNPLENTFRFTLSANLDSFRRKPVACAGVTGK